MKIQDCRVQSSGFKGFSPCPPPVPLRSAAGIDKGGGGGGSDGRGSNVEDGAAASDWGVQHRQEYAGVVTGGGAAEPHGGPAGVWGG
jgi:hypothetical protein